MSETRSWQDPDVDRRVRRTRASVVHAFADLARERSYDAFGVKDLLARADVGRSTFYAHYRGKDDVLSGVMEVFYELVAEGLAPSGAEGAWSLANVLGHFRENRLLLRRLSTGAAAGPFERTKLAFARLLERRLDARCEERGTTLSLPASHVATALAHAELALLLRWVEGRPEPPSDAVELASAMRSLFDAGVRALSRPA